jgi:hypothetical protein
MGHVASFLSEGPIFVVTELGMREVCLAAAFFIAVSRS